MIWDAQTSSLLGQLETAQSLGELQVRAQPRTVGDNVASPVVWTVFYDNPGHCVGEGHTAVPMQAKGGLCPREAGWRCTPMQCQG